MWGRGVARGTPEGCHATPRLWLPPTCHRLVDRLVLAKAQHPQQLLLVLQKPGRGLKACRGGGCGCVGTPHTVMLMQPTRA